MFLTRFCIFMLVFEIDSYLLFPWLALRMQLFIIILILFLESDDLEKGSSKNMIVDTLILVEVCGVLFLFNFQRILFKDLKKDFKVLFVCCMCFHKFYIM